MMGIQPSELDGMTWWAYQAALWNWNDRHDTGDKTEEVEAPDMNTVLLHFARLERAGLVGSVH